MAAKKESTTNVKTAQQAIAQQQFSKAQQQFDSASKAFSTLVTSMQEQIKTLTNELNDLVVAQETKRLEFSLENEKSTEDMTARIESLKDEIKKLEEDKNATITKNNLYVTETLRQQNVDLAIRQQENKEKLILSLAQDLKLSVLPTTELNALRASQEKIQNNLESSINEAANAVAKQKDSFYLGEAKLKEAQYLAEKARLESDLKASNEKLVFQQEMYKQLQQQLDALRQTMENMMTSQNQPTINVNGAGK